MILRDVGAAAAKEWFEQILQWSRKKITLDDNLDCVFVTAYIATTETEIGHPLGRTPRYIIEVAAYPNGTAGISFSRESKIDKVYLKRATAGTCTLLMT